MQGEHEELPFFVELLDYLDEHRLPVPGTIHDREGVALHSLAGKPALLYDIESKGAQAYLALAREVLARREAMPEAKSAEAAAR